MANVIAHDVRGEQDLRIPERRAYRLLHWGFVIAPVLAGLDKFAGLLADWDAYLAPQVTRMLPLTAHAFMMIVGVVEVLAGLVVALKPKIGAYVVAGWLGAVLVNLIATGHYFDIALRDFGLLLGALALGQLAKANELRHHE